MEPAPARLIIKSAALYAAAISLIKSVTWSIGNSPAWATAARASPIYIFPVCQINCAPDALILSKPSITQLLMVRAPKLPPTIRIVFLDGSSPKERIASSRLM